MFLLSLMACVSALLVGSATGLTKENYEDAERTWYTAFCGKFDEPFTLELIDCRNFNPQPIRKILNDCRTEALGRVATPLESFKAGCENGTVFEKFDDCLEPFRNQQWFLDLASQNSATETCYRCTMDKYDIYIEEIFFKRT